MEQEKSLRHKITGSYILGIISIIGVIILFVLFFRHENDNRLHTNFLTIKTLGSQPIMIDDNTLLLLPNYLSNNSIIKLMRSPDLPPSGTIIILVNQSASSIKIIGTSNLVILPIGKNLVLPPYKTSTLISTMTNSQLITTFIKI